MRRILAALLLLAVPLGAARAQFAGGMSPATVGVTAAQVLAAGAGTQSREFFNISNTATICLSFGGTPTITGTQCGGTGAIVPIAPLQAIWWPTATGGLVPTDAVSAIASAASTPLTIEIK